MMNARQAMRLGCFALALLGQREGAVAQATNCQLPTFEAQLANPVSAVVQDGGAVSFIIITLTNSAPDCTIANGTYRGWQFQYTGPVPLQGVAPAVLFSSYGDLPHGALKADWPQVNYLLNHKTGTPAEVQRALWTLLGRPIGSAADASFPLTPAAEAMVLDAVIHGEGFVPAPGEVCAILLATDSPAEWLLLEAALSSDAPQNCLITDMLWNDLNGDGAWQSVEPVLGRTELWLIDSADRLVARATTEANGFFVMPFQAVLPGVFRLYLPAHTNVARPCAAVGTMIDAGATDLFGIGSDCIFFPVSKPTSAIGDRVWADLDGDGQQDAGEPGLAGVSLELVLDRHVVARTTTDAAGHYRFADLTAGKYSIRIKLPAGYALAPPHNGTNADTDSDGEPKTGGLELNVPADTVDLSRDVGLVPLASLRGMVWYDTNRNGRRDPLDRGLGAIRGTLLDITGSVVEETATQPNGRYALENLRPGKYVVRFAKPDGTVWLPFSRHSRVVHAAGQTRPIAVRAGGNVLGVDAGVSRVVRRSPAGWTRQTGQSPAVRAARSPSRSS